MNSFEREKNLSKELAATVYHQAIIEESPKMHAENKVSLKKEK